MLVTQQHTQAKINPTDVWSYEENPILRASDALMRLFERAGQQ